VYVSVYGGWLVPFGVAAAEVTRFNASYRA
jgi:hypothetical protein